MCDAAQYQASVFNFARTWDQFELTAPPRRQFPVRAAQLGCYLQSEPMAKGTRVAWQADRRLRPYISMLMGAVLTPRQPLGVAQCCPIPHGSFLSKC